MGIQISDLKTTLFETNRSAADEKRGDFSNYVCPECGSDEVAIGYAIGKTHYCSYHCMRSAERKMREEERQQILAQTEEEREIERTLPLKAWLKYKHIPLKGIAEKMGTTAYYIKQMIERNEQTDEIRKLAHEILEEGAYYD